MTGRQEYDRTKDRQRILGKYMIDTGQDLTFPRSRTSFGAFYTIEFGDVDMNTWRFLYV